MRARAATALAATLLAFGCGKKDDSKEQPAAEAAKPADAAPAAPAGFGTVEGTVVLTGDAPDMKQLVRKSDPVCAKTPATEPFLRLGDDGALADVLVRMPPGTAPAAEPPAEPLLIDQQECTYRPYVSGVIAGQKLVVRNSDATAHNVHAKAGTDSLLNRAQPEGQPPIEQTISEPPGTVLTFTCDIHNWMRAYAVVSDHAVVATTGADGTFVLENVPAGDQVIEAWHPHLGLQKTRVKVPVDGAAKATFTFDAASFERP